MSRSGAFLKDFALLALALVTLVGTIRSGSTSCETQTISLVALKKRDEYRNNVMSTKTTSGNTDFKTFS